ncbi:MAG TPA: TIGR02453 family protein [Polyangia bacterium]|nr:TIGR02453 family protein [Polyangia bacterium]
MPTTSWFTPALFEFFADLERHNARPWFEANKARYLADVRDPFLRFIAALQPKLRKVSPHFDVDPKPVGGSLFRIHRDVRFSTDKSPYKTHAAAHFPHARCDGSAPGFYLRLSSEDGMMGAGVWHPEPPALGRIRDAIAEKSAAWKRAVAGLTLDGEQLKRVPKGYDAEHPMAEELKRKDFITGVEFTRREVCAPDFLDRFVGACRETSPLVKFLCGALELSF